MPGQPQTLATPPPVSVQALWNAIRVAFVNRSHPGAISYDPLTIKPPPVSVQTLINAARLAAEGELQS